MRLVALLTVLVTVPVSATPARAQPSLTAPALTLTLTKDEVEVLDTGLIPTDRAIVGGVLATGVGFGLGHAVQGRWADGGWTFTVGEIGFSALVLTGLVKTFDCLFECESPGADTMILAGMIGFLATRTWEAVDAWAGPVVQNRRYRALQSRLDPGPGRPRFTGAYVLPGRDRDGAVAGVGFSF